LDEALPAPRLRWVGKQAVPEGKCYALPTEQVKRVMVIFKANIKITLFFTPLEKSFPTDSFGKSKRFKIFSN